jgi:hypothetical protein
VSPRHADAINNLPLTDQERLSTLLSLPGVLDVAAEMTARGLYQADAVLVLLRAERLAAVTALVGHAINVCPPCLRRPLPLPTEAAADIERVRRVSPAWRHADTVKAGMTPDQILMRGISRKVLAGAIRRGFVEM